MNFEAIKSNIKTFVEEELLTLEPWILNAEWEEKLPKLNELREKTKALGLWLPQIPKEYGGLGLTNAEHGEVSEILAANPYGHYCFNCQAPDAGNMEILIEFGTDAQKEKYLYPLLRGDIRSCFAMTEPDHAGSNPVKMGSVALKEGDNYVINGHKWFTSACDGASFAIAMLVTDPDGDNPHERASQIIVPLDTEGFEFVRNVSIMGHTGGGWESHAEVKFNDCKVPLTNVLGKDGAGFAIAQARLGPGRIHHCMRLVGMAQYALELMSKRTLEREAFGKKFSDFSSIRQEIAISKCEIEQARLLTLSAADKMDKLGNKEAKDIIAMIKIVAPDMALKVIDRAIQILGGKGVGPDTHLAHYFAIARMLRLADGPDEVHMYQLGKVSFDLTENYNYV